jgi:RNA polymerase sigma-70 factor (ECF subfamily)
MAKVRQEGQTPAPIAIDDAALVERALSGDRWAREALVRRYFDEVTRTVTYVLENHHEVDDVVQETFLAALRGLEGLREPSALRGWLLRIAVNLSRRSIRRRRMLRALGLDRSPDDSTLANLIDETVSPEVRAEIVSLDRALTRMPTELRLAWTLRYVEGHTVRDVSRLCQSSLATTKRRLAKANRRVARAVDEEVLFHG